jgi:hypothetical protein
MEMEDLKKFSEVEFTKVIENAEPIISRNMHICNKQLYILKDEKADAVRVRKALPTNIDAWGGDKDLRKLVKVD